MTAVVAVGLLAVPGCSSGGSGGSEPEADPPPSPSATANVPAGSPTAGPASPGAPRPGSMDRPATSSGPLSQAAFPRPGQLGRGWRYAVDPGDGEEGYAGNGTPALARDPREVTQTAVPFGCPRRAPMPAPTHALEVDYTLDGARVVVVRGAFGDPATSRRFFTARTANLRSCAGRVGSTAIGPLVGGIMEPAAGALASDRTPQSDPWREVAVLDGDSVVLLAARGRDTFTPAQTRRLVRLLRT